MDTQSTPTKKLFVGLDPVAHKALKLRAVQEDTTIADLVRRALERCYGVAA